MNRRSDGAQPDGAMPSLTVYAYSQTGQLREALAALLTPLEKAGSHITWVTVTPEHPFPFPWPVRRFFGIFPDAVDPAYVTRVSLDPAEPPAADLVVLGFQVWYLAPSIPVRSLLASRSFAGQDVLGVVACRNMWYSAALDVRRRLVTSGARYLGTAAAIDAAPQAVTFVTTLAWLLRGRRAPIWRFPPAGVSASELARLADLGGALAARFATPGQSSSDPGLPATTARGRAGRTLGDVIGSVLAERDAAPIDVPTAAGDLIASRAFRAWGRVIRSSRPGAGRLALQTAFVGTLVTAIVLGLPALAIASVLGRDRLAAAVRSRLAPALAAGAATGRVATPATTRARP